MRLTRPAWIEIDLDLLTDNIKKIKENISAGTEIISVVKSNAYGFGTIKIVETLIKEGINFFAVATITEAIEIRNRFKSVKILILGYTPEYLMDIAVKNSIMLSIYRYESAKILDKIANNIGIKADIQIIIDSGMNRIGFKDTQENINIIEKISKMKNLNIKGIFSHFAAADTDDEYTKSQYKIFSKVVKNLESRKIELGIKHISNSSGILNYREYDLDAIRPGILQFGSTEGAVSQNRGFDVNYIGQVKAQISNIKTIEKGEKISYGLIYEANKKTKVATLPIGYADGILRQLSGKMDVIISGSRCKQIGRICMDQMMIDVTGINCNIGDEAVIIGNQKNEYIDILELAKKADEIATSFSCHFSKRLPKVYIKDGKIDEIVDEIETF